MFYFHYILMDHHKRLHILENILSVYNESSYLSWSWYWFYHEDGNVYWICLKMHFFLCISVSSLSRNICFYVILPVWSFSNESCSWIVSLLSNHSATWHLFIFVSSMKSAILMSFSFYYMNAVYLYLIMWLSLHCRAYIFLISRFISFGKEIKIFFEIAIIMSKFERMKGKQWWTNCEY